MSKTDVNKRKTVTERIDAFYRRLRKMDNNKKTSLILVCLSMAALLIYVVVLITTDILPLYLAIILTLIVGVLYEVLYFLMFDHKIWRRVKAFAQIICGVFSVILVVASFYLNATAHLFSAMQMSDTEVVEYVVLAKKDQNRLKGLGYLGGQTIGLYKDDNAQAVEDYLTPKIIENSGGNYGLKFEEIANLYDLANQFLKGENKMNVVCLSQAQVQFLSEEIDGFVEQVKSINRFELEARAYGVGRVDERSYDEPFVLYFSVSNRFDLFNGIEQQEKPHREYELNRQKFMTHLFFNDKHGYSEINQLIAINPKTSKILILDIPGDYLVNLNEEGSEKIILENTGFSGIRYSVEALERLYGVKIHYYLRTTFDELADFAQELGENEVNLESKFSRDEVFNAVGNRLTNSDIIWRNYSPILMVAGKTFQTNMPVGLMISLLKNRVFSDAEWAIEEYEAVGAESQQSIMSFGGEMTERQVLVPQEDSIRVGAEKIQAILESN